MAVESGPSLPYHEPGIVTILIQASFLLLLNLVNTALDKLVYCGLLGEVLLGIAWGTPGFKWLGVNVEEVIVQLGYLGLLLLVYEGGLSTSFQSLKANLLLSSAVALTGIALPMGLSFSLQGLIGATSLQAFAAGAALCSTSLGTTFTVLNSSGLSSSRLGVVLTSAAMMDDVVGLVMVQVISNLGGGDIGAVTIVRPVLVSLAFAVSIPLACRFLALPITTTLNHHREAYPAGKLNQLLCKRQTAFILHTLLLIGLATGATYAGTSNLFAAYIAGASISWWDSEVPHPQLQPDIKQTSSAKQRENLQAGPARQSSGSNQATPAPSDDIQPAQPSSVREQEKESAAKGPSTSESVQGSCTSGSAVYEHYYHQAVSKILQPFFFASVGFSIPITRMFSGNILWRGIVYTILMTIGKLACGFWLVRFSLAPARDTIRAVIKKLRLPSAPHFWGTKAKSRADAANTTASSDQSQQDASQPSTTTRDQNPAPAVSGATSHPSLSVSPPKPFSLHPPLIIALAMTARGEIGFLISALAESNGVFSSANSSAGTESDIFLIVTWAIVLCTIIGPFGVGLSVRRVKKLEARKNQEQEGSGRDVLGVWGVE